LIAEAGAPNVKRAGLFESQTALSSVCSPAR
jgi:hypothetical protein